MTDYLDPEQVEEAVISDLESGMTLEPVLINFAQAIAALPEPAGEADAKERPLTLMVQATQLRRIWLCARAIVGKP